MKDKLSQVSLFRGIAIIAIALFHSAYSFNLSPIVGAVPNIGHAGCQAFFVLSAFCLCISYEDKELKYASYFKRRFIAIASGYWITISINLLMDIISSKLLGHSIYSVHKEPITIISNFLLANGLFPSYRILDGLFRGGWFVGTLMIMYLIFPALRKAYFWNNEKWRMIRFWCFPLTIFVLSSTIMIVSGKNQQTFCELGSIKYHSIFNQITSFSLGFTLYDLSKHHRGSQLKNALFGLMPLVLAAFLFYSPQIKVSAIIAPTLIALFTLYEYSAFNYKFLYDSKISRYLCKIGDMSFAVFLCHFWVTSLVLEPFHHYIKTQLPSINENILYLCSLPVILIIIYFVSILYHKLIQANKSFLNLVFQK